MTITRLDHDRAADAATYVHPPTVLSGASTAAPLFELIAEPSTGRLTLFGELDFAGSRQFRDAVTAVLLRSTAEVVVDVANLQFIDASGIGLFVELRHELAVRGATLRVVNARAPVDRVFSLCGLSAMLAGSAAS
jgi:anti-sigma B factor antagonist